MTEHNMANRRLNLLKKISLTMIKNLIMMMNWIRVFIQKMTLKVKQKMMKMVDMVKLESLLSTGTVRNISMTWKRTLMIMKINN